MRRAASATGALLDDCGLLQRHFRRQRALRILCYHGVCADELAGAPWVPIHYVTASAFARQMEIIRRFGPVVALSDVLAQTGTPGQREESASAITFDDVAACSFVHARPILNQLGLRASFFVATGHVTTGRLLLSDVHRLVRLRPDLLRPALRETVTGWADQVERREPPPNPVPETAWDEIQQTLRTGVEAAILDTLRPMNWDEVAQLAADGHEVGAHTVDHTILGRESDEVRQHQIRASVGELERRLQRKVTGFAYPKGGPGDFGAHDAATLREVGVRYALTTRPGFANGTDVYALPRVSVGRTHSPALFALELSGLLDRRRARQYGWR